LNIILSFICLILAVGCTRSNQYEEPVLVSLNIIDRNGLNETITTKERLDKFENVDFFGHQPYQKVLRAYSQDCLGNAQSFVTSYYPNGQIKQSIEAINSRAYGLYQEWYEDGTLKLKANIIGGIADLTPAAEKSWQFDGCAQAWDSDGKILTNISYEKGLLQGDSFYYHPNGKIWKLIPYNKNQVNGTTEYYRENGQLLQTITFCNNEREGTSLRFWSPEILASNECYCGGRLISGRYFDSCGKLVSEVNEGEGIRAGFGKFNINELQEFHGGYLSGEVQVFDDNGNLIRSYGMENGLKTGEEYDYQICAKEARKNNLNDSSEREAADGAVCDEAVVNTTAEGQNASDAPRSRSNRLSYSCTFPNSKGPQPKLLITWHNGKVQGYVKTWYDNGNIESQKEMNNNRRNGLSSAWYKDGSLMLIEEYDNDRLTKGEYYKKGEKIPISEIINGKGIATIYDGDGRYIRKINYTNGKPEK
jgi:antitoxin component YwqK of YwqJK toxin-antitoxin module